ncbi:MULTISPECIES: branched-chain amino acid ABC transporter permease [Pseudothermotoga]|uniref:Inner-membrane translocator n=1 Tax=Pseudothermotoga lettingae (strain ATCC BAA-301 / DSM 14385 / NBRC 107922 / TMO) TaxID=416591 RepID=A8F6A1_PSELT|nr:MULTISPECIES: branched-chain amino acid ABC transporter permease [Pseudothermotoga]ABV33685.1 inner-membrane translocator [Pseudothermotoga lettingae TMO]MDK2885373.1 branched-chain amino acid transport system permease protein [Pseudothermotoga sp.]GLI49397.1 branched-chain amino acid ABC transporter permease [Pseudothermotoga lettingae TMO]
MILQIALTGILVGCVYSLVSVGLTLVWGLMDIINFAHGDFMMISMYTVFWLYSLFKWDPFISLPIAVIVAAALGLTTYKLIIKRLVNAPGLMALLATFGLSLFIRNFAQFLWSPNYRFIGESILSGKRIIFGDIIIGFPQLFAAVGSILITLLIALFIKRTRIGKAIQATAQNRDIAELMGVDTEKIYMLTFAISGICVGVAGTLLSGIFPVYPESGAMYGLLAFVIVALGGFGNIWGAFYAGILIGLAEALGGFYFGTQFKYAIAFLIYLLVLQFRPKGLFGW